nr:MAG TPA: hypothetical protein [Caudoviricetes sp.]
MFLFILEEPSKCSSGAFQVASRQSSFSFSS